MDKSVKEKWLSALRSGEYPQTRYTLRNENGFCCLGVLCDVYRIDTGNLEWKEEELLGKQDGTQIAYIIETEIDPLLLDRDGKEWGLSDLPQTVKDWAGVDDSVPSVKAGGVYMNLTECNDIYEMNFEKIADLIEASL